MSETAKAPGGSEARDAKFGAFKGVFTPSILTILGVIMYLRFGWVVGNGGVLGAILVVLLAHVISITTGMSIVSIATNHQVKAGGDYYMISRALGMPIGGSIGLTLFVALALSMSLYTLGFAESFLDAFGFENTLLARRIVGSIAAVTLTAITFFSTSLALKIQYFVLAAILLSLISLFAGQPDFPAPQKINLWFTPDSESFEVLFAVFFPAVTGFTAGVAMSGDLKNPRRALPRGTMGAIIFGMLVYLAIPVFLSSRVDPQMLRENKMIWLEVALVPQLVIAGVFAATLSSALGSILGGPRYLQALANDGVVPTFLGKGYGVLNEPRVATVATFIIAEAGVLVGELDLIARIITMFFLTSYGFLCLASGVQSWSGISSFRPDFRTPSWVSFIGAGTAVGIMFKLDTVAMAAAVVVMAALYFFLRKRQFKVSPGDAWRGFWSAVVSAGLQHLHRRRMDSRNWLPNALVFGGPPTERRHLTDLARWIVGERGLATHFYLLRGDLRKERSHALDVETAIREEVTRRFPEMLTRVAVTPDIYDGIRQTAQSYGLAGMTPNTVIMGWAGQGERPEDFERLVDDLLALDHNLLMLDHDDTRGFGEHQTIDVWWGGLERNGALMLLIADLLEESEAWKKPTVRINVIVDSDALAEETKSKLLEILAKARVIARPRIISRNGDDRSASEIIRTSSADADLVIMGLRPPDDEERGAFVRRTNDLLDGLGTVLLVRASTGFDGAAVLFDE